MQRIASFGSLLFILLTCPMQSDEAIPGVKRLLRSGLQSLDRSRFFTGLLLFRIQDRLDKGNHFFITHGHDDPLLAVFDLIDGQGG